MKNLKEKIRNKQLQILTNNLGRIIETDDKIICYVDKKRINKDSFTSCCNFKGNDKPLYYIINGIELNSQLYLLGFGCTIIIKNCVLNSGIKIDTVDSKVLIEDSNINATNDSNIKVDSLKIKDSNISNFFVCDDLGFGSTLDIITNNKLRIINSIIGDKYNDINLSMISNEEMEFSNSVINGDEIYCEAKRILSDEDSKMEANTITISSSDIPSINADSPLLEYKTNFDDEDEDYSEIMIKQKKI